MAEAYFRGTTYPHEESRTLEFKGHRTIAEETMNPANVIRDPVSRRNKPTRQPIDKYLCGMLNATLNSDEGGTIVLGVLDNGRIEGFMLSEYQKDHLEEEITACLDSFVPRVPRNLYSIGFVPVLEEFQRGEHIDLSRLRMLKPSINRQMKHERKKRFCWCDCEALASMNCGMFYPFWVVEIKLHPWDPVKNLEDAPHRDVPEIPPTFTLANGKCFLRKNATNEELDVNAVKMRTVQEVLKIVERYAEGTRI